MSSASRIFIASVPEGMEVKLRRVELDMPQWEVAQKANVPPWGVGSYERGDRYVPPSWKKRVRVVLGLDDE